MQKQKQNPDRKRRVTAQTMIKKGNVLVSWLDVAGPKERLQMGQKGESSRESGREKSDAFFADTMRCERDVQVGRFYFPGSVHGHQPMRL